jgi:hypothetical protein
LHGVVTSLTRSVPTALLTTRPAHAVPRMTAEPGVRFGIANAVVVAVLLAASVAPLTTAETAWVAVLSAGLAGAALRWTRAAVLGLIAWAWYTGFAENGYGQLTFAGGDLRRVALFIVAAAVLAVTTRRLLHVVTRHVHR